MISKIRFTLVILVAVLFATSCSSEPATPTAETNMPNPASVYCEQNGGRLELRQDASGGVAGACIFPDGSECDEWAYFRGTCMPGEGLATEIPTVPPLTTEPAPTATAKVGGDTWKTYENAELGYRFEYPSDAEIVPNDDPLKSISIIGPLVDDEYWPQITISHPGDREDFHPPEDADLQQWLIDHSLIGVKQQLPDAHIAGTTAIHLRHDRSPQSYAFDQYYFAKAGQLYAIVIGHMGDKEDWALYNRFLESFQFVE
jgi:putative hemolysin